MQHTILHLKQVSSQNLEDKTEREAFAGMKLEVSHFCIFGCLVYIHILVEKRTKLEPSSRKGLLVTMRLQRPIRSLFYNRERHL